MPIRFKDLLRLFFMDFLKISIVLINQIFIQLLSKNNNFIGF